MALAGVSVFKASQAIVRVLQHRLPQRSLALPRNASPWSWPSLSRFLSTVAPAEREKKKNRRIYKSPEQLNQPTSDEAKAKKSLKSPEIVLIMPDEQVKHETLETAQKLAKRRDLKLIKIVDFDTKFEKPLYRLMSSTEFMMEEIKARAQKKKSQQSASKDQKLFMVSSKSGDHDLYFKINQMLKLLKKKKHDVMVYISIDGNPTKANKVAEILENELKDDAVKQNSSSRANTLKLFFVPKTNEDDATVDKGQNEKNDKKSDKKTPNVEKKKTKDPVKS